MTSREMRQARREVDGPPGVRLFTIGHWIRRAKHDLARLSLRATEEARAWRELVEFEDGEPVPANRTPRIDASRRRKSRYCRVAGVLSLGLELAAAAYLGIQLFALPPLGAALVGDLVAVVLAAIAMAFFCFVAGGSSQRSAYRRSVACVWLWGAISVVALGLFNLLRLVAVDLVWPTLILTVLGIALPFTAAALENLASILNARNVVGRRHLKLAREIERTQAFVADLESDLCDLKRKLSGEKARDMSAVVAEVNEPALDALAGLPDGGLRIAPADPRATRPPRLRDRVARGVPALLLMVAAGAADARSAEICPFDRLVLACDGSGSMDRTVASGVLRQLASTLEAETCLPRTDAPAEVALIGWATDSDVYQSLEPLAIPQPPDLTDTPYRTVVEVPVRSFQRSHAAKVRCWRAEQAQGWVEDARSRLAPLAERLRTFDLAREADQTCLWHVLERLSYESPGTVSVVVTDGQDFNCAAAPPTYDLPREGRVVVVLLPSERSGASGTRVAREQIARRFPKAVVVPSFALDEGWQWLNRAVGESPEPGVRPERDELLLAAFDGLDEVWAECQAGAATVGESDALQVSVR